VATLRDLRDVDVAILTLGQYLRPSASHLPVEKYYHPDEFAELATVGRELGFSHVESGPLVRSSYHAKRQVPVQTTEGNRWGGVGEERRSLPPRTDLKDGGSQASEGNRWGGLGEERRSLPPRT